MMNGNMEVSDSATSQAAWRARGRVLGQGWVLQGEGQHRGVMKTANLIVHAQNYALCLRR